MTLYNVILYTLAATGLIFWLSWIKDLLKELPVMWQAAVFVGRLYRAENPPLREIWKVVPYWFLYWIEPCERVIIRSSAFTVGKIVYWPGKEPKHSEQPD